MASSEVDRLDASDSAERALGRYVAVGLPGAALVGAAAAWSYAGPGPGVLVLAGGALLGTIALLWSSVRTLSGDAPLPEDLEALAARQHGVHILAEQKGEVLRALKDLEHEHEIGKIDDVDYGSLRDEYRGRAKELLRRIDSEVEPLRPRAEALARAYLEKRGLGEKAAGADALVEASGEPRGSAGDRVACEKCSTVNDSDAAFCKKCGTRMGSVDGVA